MNRYDSILQATLGQFQKDASCFVGDASDEAIKFKIIASELTRLYDELDRVKTQMFPDTAEGEVLEHHGAVRGIFKKAAAPASGTVTFTLKSAAPEPLRIPSGTLLASSKDARISLVTTADATIPQGRLYVYAPAETTDMGAASNIAPHYVDILVTPLAGIASVDNADRIAGGADPESDESFRRRLSESCRHISNGANLSYYEQFAMSFGDVWYAKAAFTPGVSNEISLYVENFTRSLGAAVVSGLQSAAERARELNIRLVVKRPVIKKVHIAALLRVDNLANDIACQIAAGNALNDYILSLGIGERFSPHAAAAAVLAQEGVRDLVFSLPAGPVEAEAGEILDVGSLSFTVEGA